MIYLISQGSGTLPTNAGVASSTIAIPGGASNALVDSSTMYVVASSRSRLADRRCSPAPDGCESEQQYAGSAIAISDGAPGAVSRMIEADNNTCGSA